MASCPTLKTMVQRREQLASGLHERQYIMLVLPGEPQLTASPRAHAASRDSYLAALGCRDVTDGASGGSAEPQGARSASSRGSVSVCIVYIYPYHGYTGPGAVTGASRGRRDALGNECHIGCDMGGWRGPGLGGPCLGIRTDSSETRGRVPIAA